jgi:hypothetical protein
MLRMYTLNFLLLLLIKYYQWDNNDFYIQVKVLKY